MEEHYLFVSSSNHDFVYVIVWFVVIFGINTTSDISKLLYEISLA